MVASQRFLQLQRRKEISMALLDDIDILLHNFKLSCSSLAEALHSISGQQAF